ncbi:MAG: hypothetical protein QM778_14040 [Myxococcales bacterium]
MTSTDLFLFARRASSVLVALALTSVPALPAAAGDVPVDGFLPAPDQTGFIALPSTRTPGPWGVDATLWLDYSLNTLETSSMKLSDPSMARDGLDYANSPTPIHQRFDGTAIAQLGIMTRGALAVRMPFVMVQKGDDVPGKPLAPAAAGNPAIEGRIRVFGNPVRPDGSVNDGSAVALRGIVQLPVGTSDSYFADNSTRLSVSAIGDLEMFGIRLGGALGYQHSFDPDRIGDSSLSNMLQLLLGLRVPLPVIARALPGKLQESVMVELDVATNPTDFFASPTTPVEGRLAYRAVIGDFFVTLGVGAGFRPAIGSPDLRVLGAFGWSPRKHDQDADGVPDSEDQCEHLPEDRDGFQDADGCADDDNDGDLIVDEDDKCPLEPAEIGRDEDEDGCTDK